MAKIGLFALLLSLVGCTHGTREPNYESLSQMKEYPEALAHGKIQQIFPDIFFVTGVSLYHYNGNDIQKSNSMVIVRNGKELTLINTLRLDTGGLKQLDELGKVTNVIRLGAFHDRNDLFYLDRYQAKLWAVKGMVNKDNRKADFIFGETSAVPFPDASFFQFETTTQPEAILNISRNGGILVTCDSIKNWTKVDEYFSEKTANEFKEQGLIAPASIDKVWLHVMAPQKSDFLRLLKLKFKHLLSAHGQPIIGKAKNQLMPRFEVLSK